MAKTLELRQQALLKRWPGAFLPSPVMARQNTRSAAFSRQEPLIIDAAPGAGVDFHHTRDDVFFNIGGGVGAADYNGDGLLGIYVTNSADPNALYRNNGDGTFADMAVAAGVDDAKARGNGAGWGDYDNDGDIDLFVSNYGASKLFRNNCDGSFTDVTAAAGVSDSNQQRRTTGVTWGDYDQDSFLDLMVVRWIIEGQPKVMLTRDFQPLARTLGRTTTTAMEHSPT